MFIMSIPIVSFADEVITDDGPLGVITDADGNIVEVITLARMTYVDNIFTLPAGGSFRSYQYEPKYQLFMGAKFHDDNGNVIATRDGRLRLELFGSNEIGGQRTRIDYVDFSTNYEENLIHVDYYDTVGVSVHSPYTLEYQYRYYNGVCTNLSSKTIKIRIIINMV